MTHEEQRAARRIKAEKMAGMYRQGVTLEAIGRQFGVTRERVRQLIREIGVTGADGGKAKQIQIVGTALERKTEQRRRRQEQRFGVAYDLLQQLRECGATRRYQYQKRTSASRGIGFELTLAQWWAVWQASGKYHLCGKGKGHYCMSRIKDDGPYALGNVHIQLVTDNSREAVAKWEGKTKAIRGVFCLYPGRDKAWHAKVGKVSLGYFTSAEEAGAAREAYMQANDIKGTYGLGRGRGWTYLKTAKKNPYMVQVAGTKSTYHATQAEAEAEYARRCAEVLASRSVNA